MGRALDIDAALIEPERRIPVITRREQQRDSRDQHTRANQAGGGIGNGTTVLHACRHDITGADKRADQDVLREGEQTPDIRGSLRAELIRDLALGELTHEQLGERYGRAPQSIANFSSRNADEVRRAKQVQSDEYQGLGYAEKWERLAFREQLLLDIEERLKDPGLSDTQRNRYSVTAEKLLHGIAEERGQLPVRGHFELDLKGNPFAGIDAITIDDDGSLHPVEGAV